MAIIGNLYKLEKFFRSNKNLDIVFDYFKQALDKNSEVYKRIISLPVGSFEKVNITDNIFALEQVFYTKNRKKCFIESHKKYIDFQLVVSGIEQMEYIDIDKLTIDNPYNEAKDLITYKIQNNTSKFLLEEQGLAIYFTDDAHIGLPIFEEESLVHKTVIKFPIDLFNV